ncbi:MAG: hypothetical protein K6F75_00115 [Butyrivibrio sp.]|nr:hypothetical protein [Butyrivibrio sp.]
MGLDFLSTRGYTSPLLAMLTDSEDYGIGGPEDVVPLINRAHKGDGTTKLILGDSFADQTIGGLQEDNPDYAIMTSNAAVTMAGQYIIAKEYLDSHPDATDVYLFVLPESIGRTYDTEWGYQYAVLPFITTDTISDLENETLGIITNTYGKLYMNKTFATLVEKSLVNRKIALNSLRDRTDGYELSNFYELSDIYLTKLNDLCKDKGVKFHFCPCPVSEEKKEETLELATSFKDSKTYSVNPKFYKRVIYYPADWSGDGAHLKYEYRVKDYVEPLFWGIMQDGEFMQTFNFG